MRLGSAFEGIDGCGGFEVCRGETACRVGGEGEEDLGVADIDIRVVVVVFGDFGDTVDVVDGVGECFELDGFGNGFTFEFPFGDLFHLLADFFCAEDVGHGCAGI